MQRSNDISSGSKSLSGTKDGTPWLLAEHVDMDSANARNWLAAVVNNSFDAILSKTIDGVITSWNAGAQRLFGFNEQEAVGQPITLIIPQDRLSEEAEIIARLRRGELIERFETVRRAKSGMLVEVELTISPVCDKFGRIIGASKIARDIGARRRENEAQALILREMSHRIKNLLTVVQALIGQSAKEQSAEAFADDLRGSIGALARAHDLILQSPEGDREAAETTLDKLLEAILLPYSSRGRISVEVPATILGRHAVTSLALAFHELATNAVKYGVLSRETGRLSISGQKRNELILLHWREENDEISSPSTEGFGSTLLRAALRGLGGSVEHHHGDGVFGIDLRLPCDRLTT